MNTFQTLLSLVALILALCVIVQAIQEVVKSLLGTKASVLRDAMDKFMGPMLPLAEIKHALDVRGLDITALESFRGNEFRQLLDGINLNAIETSKLFNAPGITPEQVKDNMAAFFESALAAFQKAYTTRNKLFAILISAILVLALNANVVIVFEELSADATVQQAIVGKAASLISTPGNSVSGTQNSSNLGETYKDSRDQIKLVLKNYPILVRTGRLPGEFLDAPFTCLCGLLAMIGLVSLGAPFWNDVLKSLTGVNNALNGNGSAN